MGYAECNVAMESRIGSVSSGSRYSPDVRGRALKSSPPFCPRSTSKLAQSIIKDHMVSHYKKVYSAKAAIDASVPKSLIHSVKYNDQIRQERLRKSSRPQSAHSLSQRHSRASCSPAHSRLSVQYDDSPYLCSRSSTVSSPRFSTSFQAKERVYPSYQVGSQNQFHHSRSASEITYRNPGVTSHRKQSTCSLEAFRDPVQKTYSGDLLKKHSQHFTQDKPFTPKTLKSDTSSYLSNYRYYRAPRRKPTQETYHGSTKTKEPTQEFHESSQGFNTESEWNEDEFNGTYLSASRQQSRVSKSRDPDLFDTSSRVSADRDTSPVMKNVSAEEEELMYLEFISAVTEDILSRGHISDRFLDRVIKRHIDMNRHQLDEGKMRHLLEVLRKDFEESTNTCSAELEKVENGLLDAFQPHLEPERKRVSAKGNTDLFSHASLIINSNSPDYSEPLSVSTPLHSPLRTAPPKAIERDGDGDNMEKRTGSPLLSEHVSNNKGFSEEDSDPEEMGPTSNGAGNENHEYAAITSDAGFNQDHAEISYSGRSEDLEDLGRSLSESLHVSSETHCNNVEVTVKHTDTAASFSDSDEF